MSDPSRNLFKKLFRSSWEKGAHQSSEMLDVSEIGVYYLLNLFCTSFYKIHSVFVDSTS